jgi:hypothetical protein
MEVLGIGALMADFPREPKKNKPRSKAGPEKKWAGPMKRSMAALMKSRSKRERANLTPGGHMA